MRPIGTGGGSAVRTALQFGAVAIAAVVVAEGAVLLLRPRAEAIEPLSVAIGDFFDPQQVERAENFRDGQRALSLAGIGLTTAALVSLALGRPRFARRRLEGLARRPVLGAAAAGAALSVTIAIVGLPLSAIAHERAADVGLSTQDLAGWLADEGKSVAIGALLTAAGAAILLALVRRLPRAWWAAAAGGVVVYAVVSQLLFPVVLAPLFNDFERLPPFPARDSVLELAERAGVEVGDVYEVDASRRSTAFNAYVSGIGPTKRVVIYDNLLSGVERPALEAVLAHELAHARNDDIWRGLAFIAIVAPLGMLAFSLGGTALARRGGADPAAPAALPAYGVAIGLVSLVIGVAGAQLSRDVEVAADGFALRLTDDPRALIDLQTELADRNLSDPDPPRWSQLLFGSHPTTLERIGAAEAYSRDGD
ncbi:MAG: M48 family metalloprotease [Solirubrobacterales bacterium]